MAETTPITVLTGFLGAGKTTMLNHLVCQPEFARAAVLINEFGEIGLDHLLVEKLDHAAILLNAGCLCCTVRGDLARILREMLPRARRDEITRIVIETTGLADPLPILATLMTDPIAVSAYRLDGIVTVVDAVNGLKHLNGHEEAVRQAAVADRIVISKADLADPAPLRERLRTLNPVAQIIEAANGVIDPALILNAGLFNPAARTPDVDGWLNTPAEDATHHHHDPNRHDSRIRAFSMTLHDPLDWRGVAMWLEMLITSKSENVLRMKGILNLKGYDQPVAVHAVHHLMHPPSKLPVWPDSDPRTSRIVFVTRDLTAADLYEGFHAFQAASTAPH